jgi:DNA/RNA endonuclease YhcR with UshA esterase domain
MMSERITYLALATSIVGLLVLTYASEAVNPPKAPIFYITQADVGKTVRIEGSFEDVHLFKGGSAVLKIRDENASIDVYMPYDVSQKTNASSFRGTRVDVAGTVSVYKGKLELVVKDEDRIKALK